MAEAGRMASQPGVGANLMQSQACMLIFQMENSEQGKITFTKKEYRKRKIKLWTNEQDELLLSLAHKHFFDWKIISSFFPTRNTNQLCSLRHKKEIWTSTQDQLVLKLVDEIGKNWGVIAKYVANKSGKQIRQRYINKLDPSIKTQDWTMEEDHAIIEYYNKLGSRWKEISQRLVGRPENKVKNRFYSHIKRFYLVQNQLIVPTPKNNPQPLKQEENKQAPQAPPEAEADSASMRQLQSELMPILQQPRLKEKSSFFKCYQLYQGNNEGGFSCGSFVSVIQQ